MRDAAACAHALHFAWPHHGAVSHRILVGQSAFDDVGNDFHVSVGMGGESCATGDAVVVDDTKGTVAHVVGVKVVGERETMMAVEPPVVRVSSFIGGS